MPLDQAEKFTRGNFGIRTFFAPFTKSGSTLVPLPCANDATCSITSLADTNISLAKVLNINAQRALTLVSAPFGRPVVPDV